MVGLAGLANLGVLRQLADLMVVPYDFDFYKLDFEADSPFLVLSKTRTILGGAVICEVPVETPSSTGGDEDSMAITTSGRSSLPEETLERLRLYLAAVSELKVQMNDDIARQVQLLVDAQSLLKAPETAGRILSHVLPPFVHRRRQTLWRPERQAPTSPFRSTT